MAETAAPAAIAVRMTGIHKRFGAVVANADVNLTVRTGTVHGLVGENGAGKSTLMKILAGLDRPDTGQVRLHAGARVALLRQTPEITEGRSLFEEAVFS